MIDLTELILVWKARSQSWKAQGESYKKHSQAEGLCFHKAASINQCIKELSELMLKQQSQGDN